MSEKPSSAPFMGLKNEVQLTQRLMMSAHMQQALYLLQLPLQELEPFIEEQIVQNPILEMASNEEEESEDELELPERFDEETEVTIDDRDLSILSRLEEDFRDHFDQSESLPIKRTSEEDKFKTYLEQSILAEPSLREQLLFQAHDTFETPRELDVAEILIGYIDPCGFLQTPLKEISHLHDIPESELETILKAIQTFDPFGVGAANLQESLLIQLRCLNKEKSLAYEIVAHYYDDLLHNHIPAIQRKSKRSYEEIQKAIEEDIAKLDLHPGSHYSSLQVPKAIVPDVTIRQEGDHLIVEVEKEYLPLLRLNHRYLRMLTDESVPKETKHFVKHHLLSARWLVRNLEQRFSTIEKIAQVLSQKQRNFFMHPEGQLHSLTMKMVAEELNIHESTVARTVANKYVYSPRGLFPLRFFFTTKYTTQEGEDLSASTIKETIVDLIAKEDKQHPLSDEKLSHLLQEKGFPCARRTVAKYRLLLQIGNAQQRKKYAPPKIHP